MIEFTEFMHTYGLIGLFLFAFISNAIPYSTVPYLVVLAPLIANYRGSELALVIMSLALGATLGKLVVYLVGRGVSSINKVQRVFSGMRSLTVTYSRSTFMSRVTFLIVFLAAALPIPDDVVYIPVGLSKYSLPLFFIAVLLGKIIITLLAALYGVAFRFFIEDVAGLPPVVYAPLMLLITVSLILAGNRVNWENLIEVYNKEGFLTAIKYMITCILHNTKKT